MTDFIAIDFETANGSPSSVCSVGVVIVRGGEVVDSFCSLICQQVHGLGPDDTEDAPLFPEVWDRIEDRILAAFEADDFPVDVPFIAHNARFDEGCLRAVHAAYGLRYPDYHFKDTLWASRRHFGHSLPNHQLQTVAAACGYDLTRHHHALADAEACAAIALQIL